FPNREKARQELERLGERAAPALRRAAGNLESAQVRRSARQLLERLEEVKLTPEQLRAVRAVEILERIGTAETTGVLNQLAAGADEVAPTPHARAALQRLRKTR